MLEAARATGLEGILAKRRRHQSTNRAAAATGSRSKSSPPADFVICGFTHGERDYFSSLVLGVYDHGELVHVGQVGTGFNEKSLTRHLFQAIEPLIVQKSALREPGKALRDVTWVKPELVCRDQVSRSGRRMDCCARRRSWICGRTRIRRTSCVKPRLKCRRKPRHHSFNASPSPQPSPARN